MVKIKAAEAVMGDTPEYERSQIDTILAPKERAMQIGTAIYLCPQTEVFDDIYVAAVQPALRANDVISLRRFTLFDSDSPLSEIYERLQTIELLIVDISYFNPYVTYVLGLAHAMKRCPLLMAEKHSLPLPFDMGALRCVEYERGREGLRCLRDDLTRVIRIFLSNVRGSRDVDRGVA